MIDENKSRLDRIEDNQQEILDLIAGDKIKIKKQKEFKLPWRARLNKKQGKANYVTVMKINENRQVNFIKEPIIEQTIMVDDVPRLASGEYVLNYKGKPLLVQPSWSVVPFSPSEHYKDSLKDGSNIVGYRLILNRMKLEAIKIGKKIGGWSIAIILGLIVGAIIIYALWKG